MDFVAVLKLWQEMDEMFRYEHVKKIIPEFYSTILKKLESGKCMVDVDFTKIIGYPFQYYGKHCEVCEKKITENVWMTTHVVSEHFSRNECKWLPKEESHRWIPIMFYELFFCSEECQATFDHLPENLLRVILPNVECEVCKIRYLNNFDSLHSYLNKRVWHDEGRIFDTLSCWRKRNV